MVSFVIWILFISTFAVIFTIRPVYGVWWNSDWTYRKVITIDHTKVGETLTSFPVLIDLTDSDLASKGRTDGGDIVFTDDLNNKFDHEIEFFNSNTGKLIVWVEVPSLSSTIDTVMYMYYGNQASSSQQNVRGTWDSNYVMVQHLKEATGLFYDSTSNGNNGTAYGTISRNVTGKLDGAVSFDANHDDYIDAGTGSTLNFGTGNFTISMWLNAATQPGDFYTMLKKLRTQDNEYGYTVRCGGAGTSSTRDSIEFCIYDGTTWKHANTASGVLNSAWRYVVALRTGDNIRILVDGAQAAQTTGASGINVDTTGQLWLSRHSTVQWYTGKMDEVRMSNVARSAGWITTEYNNQANPSTFYNIGVEEAHEVESPVVSNPSPSNGAIDVSTSLSKLSFDLFDYQNDSMDYYVTTSPDIGSRSDVGVYNGTYEVMITGLQRNTTYAWHMNVTDPSGSGQWTNKTYSFTTIDQLRILSYSPSTKVTLDRGTLGPFQISYNVPLNTTWHLSGVQQEIDVNQQTASWTNRFSNLGIFNVTAEGTDGVSFVKQEWSVQIIINFSGGVVERRMTNFGPSQAWEQGWVFDETIFKEGNMYHMLYSASPIGSRKIGYAWSYDGFNWTKYAGNPILSTVPGTWEEKEVFWTSTILKINDTYWVYYQAIDNAGNPRSGLARGTSLTNLTRYSGNPIINDTYELTVTRYNDTLWIAYNGYSALNFLNSSDGMNWNYVQRNILLPSGSGWDSTVHYAAHILLMNDTMYLTVQGNNKDGGVDYCRVGDWTNLTKSPYNPILPHGTGIENFVLGPCPIYNETLDALDIWYLAVESLGGTGQSGLGFGRVYNVTGSNTAPSVSNPSPSNGAVDIPITLSSLNFNISDSQYDSMNYTVTTFPSIGTSSSTNVSNGRYSTSVSGLVYSTTYSWNVSVYDGQLWINQIYAFTTEPKTTFDPFSEGWNYRKKITVDHTKVNGDQSEFPVVLDVTDPDLVTKAQSDGDDIVFMNATGEAMRLKHEIELYSISTGHLVAWVKIPSLSSTLDTVVYMYYGNPSCTSQQQATGVWDSNFLMVQHLEEGSGTCYDSTIQHNDGTPTGVTQGVIGKIDGAVSFDGASDYIECANTASLNPTTVTVEAWIKPSTITGTRPIVEKYDYLASKGSYIIRQQDNDVLFVVLAGTTDHIVYAYDVLLVGNWYYLTGTFDGNTLRIYVNGTLKNQVSWTGTIWSSDQSLKIGTRGNDKAPTSFFFNGIIDEPAISKTARSGGWIATRYNNQLDASTFYTIAEEETRGPPEILVSPTTTDAAIGHDYTIYINITNVADLYAWEFQLSYNKNMLDLTSTSIVSGGLNEPTETFYSLTDETTGHLWWAVSTRFPTTSGITYAEHAIFQITFHTIGLGSSNLSLYGTFLSYSNGSEIVHTVVNGSICVSGSDLTISTITILDHTCSIYANDIDAANATYYYPVEILVLNTGAVDAGSFYLRLQIYYVTGSTLEAEQELFVSGLAHGSNTIVNFTGLFHPLHTGYYRLTAIVDSRNEVTEADETNNALVKDDVKVTMMGDVNNDGVVDIIDGVVMSLAWGAVSTDPWYDIKADIDHNGTVNILDATRAGLHWGETM